MTDKLDEITEKLKKTSPIRVPEKGKNDAISMAMQAFDKKHAPRRQGLGFGDRLMGAVHAAFEPLRGDQFMRKAYVVVGSVCVAALAVTLLNTSYLSGVGPQALSQTSAIVTALISG